jgi:Ca2+-binding EF-hand superfamily protein
MASGFCPDDDTNARRVRTVMRQVEDRIFDGKHKMYQVFRKFDKDGDGYVSYKDFEDHLLSNKINVT